MPVRPLRALAAACLGLALLAASARADVTLPAVFSDGMVLQRDRPLPVWGGAARGERVQITLADQTKSATTDAKGRWQAVLDPLPVGGPHTLVVRGRNEIALKDVLVGEVWVCSGQSNMQWPLSAARDAETQIAAATLPGIRLLTVPRQPREEAQETFEGRWVVCSPETAKAFSAVGYFFGRELHRALDVPVGLINTSYGGTPAEAWASTKALAKRRELAPLLERWDKVVAREKGDAKGRQRLSAHRPGNLFNGMVAPLVPFAIRGVVWYQGESNASRAQQYRTLFPTLIRDWRDRWACPDLPFYFVQLANFKARAPEPGQSAWAELREAQFLTLKEVPATGMAVTIDIGEANDIHPRNKQDVGTRLAAWALARDYGRAGPVSGPLYTGMKRVGDSIVLSFEHVDGGLQASDAEALRGFAIAGRDRVFVWAQARVEGDTVVVSCPTVKRPAAVRYGWADNPDCTLVNGAGLPASPFRTDDWPGLTDGKD